MSRKLYVCLVTFSTKGLRNRNTIIKSEYHVMPTNPKRTRVNSYALKAGMGPAIPGIMIIFACSLIQYNRWVCARVGIRINVCPGLGIPLLSDDIFTRMGTIHLYKL